MDKQLKEIEIPFGAKDSELCGWECTIPEGMEATIVDNKIVVKKKDSADERIINNIKKAVESYWSDEPLHEILAWLEKKCEQKPKVKYVYTKFRIGDVIVHGDNTPVRVVYIGNGSYQCESDDLKIRCSFPISEENDYELVNQKPAWSEEDEYCLAGAIETELYMLDVVNGVKKFDVGNESIKEECTRELAWLKSLKERIQPQNTWKPSDEQMQALCSKLPLLTGSGNEVQRVLETLYCDLKKLRNE